ncbi:DHS-like NAD/FAD-binding domain-containing protein [Phascolomyces articulosus]|uniref:DHS-like NAD/FAD-binding domain-containing protein n=1 Tax=Phascolomyces articulosus TaxID=60185 RepID=A0AAD5PAW6_9FUNG|nr:DHS-like NAD/FAD-binding domain-containing protein [Phascolomyces articulosus]
MVRASPFIRFHRSLTVSSCPAASKVWSATIKIPELKTTQVSSTIPDISDNLDAAARLVTDFLDVHKGKTLVVTGAGVSTDSGIPDYRGDEGTYIKNPKHRPILFQELVSSDMFRRRYWARGFMGWGEMSKARPNPTHDILAWLMQENYIVDLITQNVDYLHRRAAFMLDHEKEKGHSDRIVELHGTLFQVECLDCRSTFDRHDYQRRLFARNPYWANLLTSGEKPKINPDGDVELPDDVSYADFDIPPCNQCSSRRMKPRVVFFGENIKPHVTNAAENMVRQSEAVLVIGSSLATYSSYRLIRLANELKKPVGILCKGSTRADALASWKISMGCTPVLQRVQQQLKEKLDE